MFLPAFVSPSGRRGLSQRMDGRMQRQLHQRRADVIARLRAAGYDSVLVNGGGAGEVCERFATLALIQVWCDRGIRTDVSGA